MFPWGEIMTHTGAAMSNVNIDMTFLVVAFVACI